MYLFSRNHIIFNLSTWSVSFNFVFYITKKIQGRSSFPTQTRDYQYDVYSMVIQVTCSSNYEYIGCSKNGAKMFQVVAVLVVTNKVIIYHTFCLIANDFLKVIYIIYYLIQCVRHRHQLGTWLQTREFPLGHFPYFSNPIKVHFPNCC